MGRAEAGAARLRRSGIEVECGRVGATGKGVKAVLAVTGGVLVVVGGCRVKTVARAEGAATGIAAAAAASFSGAKARDVVRCLVVLALQCVWVA